MEEFRIRHRAFGAFVAPFVLPLLLFLPVTTALGGILTGDGPLGLLIGIIATAALTGVLVSRYRRMVRGTVVQVRAGAMRSVGLVGWGEREVPLRVPGWMRAHLARVPVDPDTGLQWLGIPLGVVLATGPGLGERADGGVGAPPQARSAGLIVVWSAPRGAVELRPLPGRSPAHRLRTGSRRLVAQDAALSRR